MPANLVSLLSGYDSLSLGSGSFLICSRTISLLDLFSCSAIASSFSLSSQEIRISRRESSLSGFGTVVPLNFLELYGTGASIIIRHCTVRILVLAIA